MKSLVQRSIDALIGYKLSPTVSDLAQFGPLGYLKMRRQLGRSDVLHRPESGALGTRQNNPSATLLEAGVNGLPEIAVGDALAQQVVVTCTVDYDIGDKDPTTRVCNVIGTLSWGGDGHSFKCDFDWRNGTVIRPVGSSFRVSARLAEDALGNAPASDARVGAWVGYGSPAQGPFACTLTQRVASTPGALPIPVLAQYVTPIWAWGEGDGPVELRWYAGPTQIGASAVIGGSNQCVPVPGGGATRVEVRGTEAPVVVIWTLAL